MPQSRREQFPDERRQHLEKDGLKLNSDTVSGSIPVFNATHARFDTTDNKPEHDSNSQVQYHWRSRDNRKGKLVPISNTCLTS